MVLNKWIQFALSALLAFTAWAAAFDWTTIFSQRTAATIAGVIGLIKLITNAMAPAPGKTADATGGPIITHSTS